MDKQKSLEVLKLRVVQTEEIKREKLMNNRIDVVTRVRQCQWREKAIINGDSCNGEQKKTERYWG